MVYARLFHPVWSSLSNLEAQNLMVDITAKQTIKIAKALLWPFVVVGCLVFVWVVLIDLKKLSKPKD